MNGDRSCDYCGNQCPEWVRMDLHPYCSSKCGANKLKDYYGDSLGIGILEKFEEADKLWERILKK